MEGTVRAIQQPRIRPGASAPALARVNPLTARVLNRLLLAPEGAGEFHGEARRLVWLHGGTSRAEAMEATWTHRLVIRGGGVSAVVRFDAALTALLASHLATGLDMDALPDSLACGAWNGLIDDLLDAAEPLCGHPLAVRSVTRSDAAPSATDLVFRLETPGSSQPPAHLAVCGDPESVRMLDRIHRHSPLFDQARVAPPADVTVAARVSLEPLNLPMSTILALRRGDVLVPGAPRENPPLRIHVGAHHAASARATEDGYRLEEDLMPTERNTDNTSAFEPGDIEVDIEFDIGSTRLSVADLGALRRGYVLAVPESGTDRVLIRANGTAVARGELVSLGDQLGVRVLEKLTRD